MSANHNFGRERSAEGEQNRGLSLYQPNALPLGQTGSRACVLVFRSFSVICVVTVLRVCMLVNRLENRTFTKVTFPVIICQDLGFCCLLSFSSFCSVLCQFSLLFPPPPPPHTHLPFFSSFLNFYFLNCTTIESLLFFLATVVYLYVLVVVGVADCVGVADGGGGGCGGGGGWWWWGWLMVVGVAVVVLLLL